MVRVKTLLHLVTRRQDYSGCILETRLKRCLQTAELTFFGIANMIGAGLFVLTGTLMKIAGPAGVLSYIISGISAISAGMCYAELATLLPKTGSCYTFTYFAIGELYAFVIGWTMISDCIVGYAAVSKAFSAALDVVTGDAISNGTIALIGRLSGPALAPYPDFVAFGLVVVVVCIVACGAKDSLIVNAVLTSLLLSLMAIIIVSLFVFGNHLEYWTTSAYGGFMPYGIDGVLQGASICVFAFGAFDTIANASEEARKPQYSIPRAMIIVILVVTTIYCSACAGLSLFVNKDSVDLKAPFAFAFLSHNQLWLFYVCGIATMIATSDMSFMYILPRMLYALASDGLIFPFFAHISKRTQVPLWGLLIGGSIAAVLALLIDLSSLAEMTAIGMLLSYSTVGINLLIVRYNDLGAEVQFQDRTGGQAVQDRRQEELASGEISATNSRIPSVSSLCQLDIGVSCGDYLTVESMTPLSYPRFRRRFKRLNFAIINFGLSEQLCCNWIIAFYVTGCVLLGLTCIMALQTTVVAVYWFVALLMVPISTMTVVLPIVLLYTFKPAHKKGVFELPLMPIIPCLSILLNVFLLMTVQGIAWLRFACWVVVGLFIYFSYGMRHSVAGARDRISNGQFR